MRSRKFAIHLVATIFIIIMLLGSDYSLFYLWQFRVQHYVDRLGGEIDQRYIFHSNIANPYINYIQKCGKMDVKIISIRLSGPQPTVVTRNDYGITLTYFPPRICIFQNPPFVKEEHNYTVIITAPEARISLSCFKDGAMYRPTNP